MPRPPEELSRNELVEALRDLRSDGAFEAEQAAAVRVVRALALQHLELELQERQLREARRQLDAARHRQAELDDTAPVGFCTLDRDSRLLDLSATAELILGTRAAARGKYLSSMIAIDERRGLREHIERCAVARTRSVCEVTLQPEHGGPLALQLVSTPMVDRDDEFTGCRTALVDISALRRSELRLRFLAHASKVLASTLDWEATLADVVRSAVPLLADLCFADVPGADGRLRRIEIALADPAKAPLRARLQALVPDDAGGSPQAQVLRSAQPILLAECTPSALAGALPEERLDAELIRECGARSLMFVPITTRGKTLGVLTLVAAESGRRYSSADVAFAQDLCSRAALAIDNAQLFGLAQQAIRAREEVLSVVSHDLNNPINSIMLNTAALARLGAGTDARARKHLDAIERASRRMERLVADLLDLSSLDAGHLAVEVSEHDVAALLAEVGASAEPMASKRDIELTIAPVSGPLRVRGDRERVLQIFANLVGNAIKFTPQRGHVEIAVSAGPDLLRFSVRDDGPGIPPDVLPHVFDRYWQAARTAHMGRGLGLYISRGLVEAQGGTIGVESRPGAGAEFHFTLPRAPLDPPEPTTRLEPAPARPATVLIVDDEEDAREALRDVLVGSGHGVVTCADGAEALAYLRGCAVLPRLLLLDVQMPVMDGPSLVRAMQADARLGRVPVVFLSARANLKQEAEALGVSYLSKPFRLTRLLEQVGMHTVAEQD